MVFFALIFWLGGLTSAHFALPNISAKDITDNDWFKLAKDTGLVYLVILLPVVAVSIYLTVFELLGRLLSTIFTVLFSPERRFSYAALSASDLEPIALTLPNDDFTLHQIVARSYEMVFKFHEQNRNDWMEYQKELARLTGSSIQYLGDFCTLLLFWIVLFETRRTNSWIQLHGAHFWLICLILFALIWFASMRASSALAAQPIVQIMNVSAMMRTHPSVVPVDENAEDKRQDRRSRLDELLTAEKEREAQRTFAEPSFRRLFGLMTRPKHSYYIVLSDRDKLSLYERGEKLRHGSPDDLSFADVCAYKYYITCNRLKVTCHRVAMLLRYAIMGTPW
jgi:hypothetical protein